jgi:hypothetical protein
LLYQAGRSIFMEINYPMPTLKTIDRALTAQLGELQTALKRLSFTEICQFSLKNKSIDTIPWDDLEYPGIYFIEIRNCGKYAKFKDWANAFVASWKHKQYKGMFVANPKQGRIKQHEELFDWIPLYIGKSKNIGGRVREHLDLKLESRTYALKLRARDHLKNDQFRLSTVRIYVDNYDVIMPVAEHYFRNKIHPIVGRQ